MIYLPPYHSVVLVRLLQMGNIDSSFLQKLTGLGLSSNEAMIYMALLEKSPLTGYEVAKRCNLSRGSVYTTLERLVEKGSVQKTVDNKYLAADLEQFIKNRMSYFSDCADYLKNNSKARNLMGSGESVFHIHGHGNILRCVKEMIATAKIEISLTAFKEELNDLRDFLIQAHKRNIKLNIISFGNFRLNGMDIVSHSREDWIFKKVKGRYLTIIRDMEEGLIGSLDDTENCMASWSKNPHYCENVYLYISHEIALIKVFDLLDKPTISKIRSEIKDDHVRALLEGVPSFNK